MKRVVLFLTSLVLISLACAPTSPDESASNSRESIPDEPVAFPLRGFVFEDQNRDGLYQSDEPLLDDILVELVLVEFPDSEYKSVRTEDGYYQFEVELDRTFVIKFSPANSESEVMFTTKNAGDDAIDSDVDANGETGLLTFTPDFNRTLSAGFLPMDQGVEAVVVVEDENEDCHAGSEETLQTCPADLQSCAINTVGAPDFFRFVCYIHPFDDASQFDLYIGLNLDKDPETGISDIQRLGVDAEIFANGLDEYINFTRYDPNGVFLDTSQLDPETSSMSFLANEDLRGGALVVEVKMDEILRGAIPQDAEVSFRVIHYPTSGAQVHDDTPAIGDVFLTQSPLEDEADLVHVVRAGENLFRISLLYGVPVEILTTVNNLSTGPLSVGQRLYIPSDGWE